MQYIKSSEEYALARFAVATVGILELLVGLLFAFYAISPLTDKLARPFFGSHVADSAIFGVATCLILVLIIGLFRRSKFAW
jgi:hypothetical protein